jgi:hypothetical protein
VRRAALAAALLGLGATARALEWAPIGGVQALGGLHAFNGDRGAFSGDLDGTFAAALNLSDRWALAPSVRGVFEGTRRLTDVLGTATPAQQRADGRVGILGVYGDPSSRWRFKPAISYEAELLKETRDEVWGHGLFDHQTLTVGAEVELITDAPHSLRFRADWFKALYPNYTTLESQAAYQFQGRSLSRELVGEHALDREGYQFALAGDAPLGPRAVLEGKTAVVWSGYPNQRIVDEGGQFKPDNREDVLADASLAVRMPHDWNADLRALGAFELGLTVDSSNQNGYDATRGRFLPGFYDFTEWRAVPSLTVIVGPARRPVRAVARLGWKRRAYPHRPAQNESGAYGSAELTSTEWSAGLALTYPMAKSVSLLFDLSRASASSNQDFQPFYRYSYEATTALAGVRWDW